MRPGKITLLSLPIGNLEDITGRTKKALHGGERFICEDTRSFQSLLRHLKIEFDEKKLLSFHDHSSLKDLERIIERLKAGEDFYLVSDAGSPIISDPAYPLLKKAVEENILLDSFPGPSSLIMALELSGLPPHPFTFMGFFPREREKRRALLALLEEREGTFLFFDSPHRVIDNTAALAKSFPHADFFLGRELTKKFQECYRFQGRDFEGKRESIKVKGEFVMAFYLKAKKENNILKDAKKIEKLALDILTKGNRPKLVAKLLGLILSQSVDKIYQELNQK